jgi:SPP1 family holin
MEVKVKQEIKTDTIIRTICLALALVNQILTAYGKSPLPIKDAQVEVLVSTTLTVICSVWGWWKNNSFTPAALAGDSLMRAIKNRGEKLDDVEGVK